MTASVTGCSTWIRPFSSRKKNSRSSSDELGRARADVADRAREADRGVAQLRAQGRVETGRRRFLEHLLVAALHRAVTLTQRQHRAVGVGKQLNLDVPWPFEVALEVDAVVAEGRLRLALRCSDRVGELARRAHDAHPAPAAARRGLDDQRRLARLRDRRHACVRRNLLRGELVAAGAQGLRRRPDPGQAGRRRRLLRSRRSRRGSRSRDESRPRPVASQRARALRDRGMRRSRRPRRRSARATTRCRRSRRRRRRRGRARVQRGKRAARSLHDSRRAPSARADPSRPSARATVLRT